MQSTTSEKRQKPKVSSTKLRVLIVTHYFPPHRGGIENVAFSQAKALSEQGHSVTVVTSDVPHVQQSSSSDVPFTIIRVPVLNILESKFGVPYPIFSPRLFSVLRKQIKHADVVHIHGHVYMTSVLSAFLARHFHKSLVLTQHNTFIEYQSRMLRSLQTIADNIFGKYTIKTASAVLTVSPATSKYVNSIVHTETKLHYNGIDIERFRPTENRNTLRDELELPRNKKICFCVRRITFKNGIDTLLETAEYLRDHKDILFVIGGKGPDLEAIQNLVAEKNLKNVKLLGSISEEDLPRYYAASDIFILPSKKGEGFPLVILEALASGVPVIATRSGGHAELIESSNFGYVVEPNAPDSIGRRVHELCSKPTLLARMQQESRKFSESAFSWEKNVADLLNTFEETLA